GGCGVPGFRAGVSLRRRASWSDRLQESLGTVEAGLPAILPERRARRRNRLRGRLLQRLRYSAGVSGKIAHGASAPERLGVEGDVLADEGGDEIIAVVVVRLHAEAHVLAVAFAGVDEQFRVEFALEKLVGAALVDKDRTARPCPGLDQGGCVVGGPRR